MNTFNGGSPAPNPYFGSISPNGLNLGLVNVNPLVSFQFAKNEYGEKTFKPLVNLHVTPNENIINKVGALFKAKKYGFGGYGGGGGAGPSYNQHYHSHTHIDTPSGPIYRPHHYESGPPSLAHFEGPPHHHHFPPSGPPHFDGATHYSAPHLSGPHYSAPHLSEPHYSAPPDYYPTTGYAGDFSSFGSPAAYDTSYHANTNNNIESSLLTSGDDSTINNFQPSTGYYSRSANISIADRTYANNFSGYKPNNLPQAAKLAQANGQINTQKQGTQSVSFPSNRRKRNVDNGDSDTETNHETIAPKSKRLEKVIFI